MLEQLYSGCVQLDTRKPYVAVVSAFVRCVPEGPAAWLVPGSAQCSPALLTAVWNVISKLDQVPPPLPIQKLGVASSALHAGALTQPETVIKRLKIPANIHCKKVVSPAGGSDQIRVHFSGEACESLQPMLDSLADAFKAGAASITLVLEALTHCKTLGCLARRLLAEFNAEETVLDLTLWNQTQIKVLFDYLAHLGAGQHHHQQQVPEFQAERLLQRIFHQARENHLRAQEEATQELEAINEIWHDATRRKRRDKLDLTQMGRAVDGASLVRAIAVSGDTSPAAVDLMEILMSFAAQYVELPGEPLEYKLDSKSCHKMWQGQAFLQMLQLRRLPYSSAVAEALDNVREQSLKKNQPSPGQQNMREVLEGMEGKKRGLGIASVSQCEARLPRQPHLWAVDVLVETFKGFYLIFEYEGKQHKVHGGLSGATLFRNNILGGWVWYVIMVTEEEWARAATRQEK